MHRILVLFSIICLTSAFNATEDLLRNLNRHGWDPRRARPECTLTTPEIIKLHGYQAEEHKVHTDDGYILTMHRIRCTANCNKQAYLLQHGFLCSSADWVLAGKGKSLPYNLTDKGYDVWLGNYRGNRYSREHECLNPDTSDAYWDFCFDEMCLYDLPAMIDYILKTTENSEITYVGHSMGTTGIFAGLSGRPEYNQKIKAVHAIAPVAYCNNMKSPLRYLAPFAGAVDFLSALFNCRELPENNEILKFFAIQSCLKESPLQHICYNIYFLLMGYNMEQLDKETLEIIMAHMPAGSSVKTLVHFAQLINSGRFCKFDYGVLGNWALYGQSKPPSYDLSHMTTICNLIYGLNDLFAAVVDVKKLHSELPNSNLIQVSDPKCSHGDVMFGKDDAPEVFNHILPTQ